MPKATLPDFCQYCWKLKYLQNDKLKTEQKLLIHHLLKQAKNVEKVFEGEEIKDRDDVIVAMKEKWHRQREREKELEGRMVWWLGRDGVLCVLYIYVECVCIWRYDSIPTNDALLLSKMISGVLYLIKTEGSKWHKNSYKKCFLGNFNSYNFFFISLINLYHFELDG